jgi:hypothetical protein
MTFTMCRLCQSSGLHKSIQVACIIILSIVITSGLARGEDSKSTNKPLVDVPYDEIAKTHRDKVKDLIDHPTLKTRGPAESFKCKPADYQDFLEHPDKAVKAWRKLGAKCISIEDRGKGRFGWTDEQGSDLHWDTVFSGPTMRIWYAEGKVNPGPLLPNVAVKAVVLFHFSEGKDKKGRTVMRHQAEVYVHTNNLTAALAAKLMGPSAPKIAEQYVAQMQRFFAALAWYCELHPDWQDEDKAAPIQKSKSGK